MLGENEFLSVSTFLVYFSSKCSAEDVALVEFLYLVFTRMPGESYRRRLMSLLAYLCDVFRALINSLDDDDELMLNVLRCHLTY